MQHLVNTFIFGSMENKYHCSVMERAIHFIVENYREQPNLEAVSAHVCMSKYHFQRLFHRWVGVTPKQFLQFTTIEHAKKCLQEGRSTLATAYEVGLSGNGRLHDMFIKIEACTPGAYQKKGDGLRLKYQVIDTPFGEMLVAESSLGICQLSFLEINKSPREQLLAVFPEARFINELGNYGHMVKAYFTTWKIPEKRIVLDLKGTPFQISVWRALLSIPSAQYLAYNDIANMIDRPNAVRAVSSAIGSNPIAYLIPCHRIIRKSGEMGGYKWGKSKNPLINGYEQIKLSNKRIA